MTRIKNSLHVILVCSVASSHSLVYELSLCTNINMASLFCALFRIRSAIFVFHSSYSFSSGLSAFQRANCFCCIYPSSGRKFNFVSSWNSAIRKVCSTYGWDEKFISCTLYSVKLNGREPSGDLSVEGRIIWKWSVGNRVWRYGLDSSVSRWAPVAGFWDHGNKPFGSTQDACLCWLNDC
jgi:hypothetical protein